MEYLARVQTVEPLEAFKVRLGWTTGTHTEVDLEPYLHGPIFEPIRTDVHMFRTVRVDHDLGTIVWNNGADIDPDVLYHAWTPAWMESEVTQ